MRKPACKHQLGISGRIKVVCDSTVSGEKYTTAHKCALHGRCLPYWWGPWPENKLGTEAKIYTLCHPVGGSCPDYKE